MHKYLRGHTTFILEKKLITCHFNLQWTYLIATKLKVVVCALKLYRDYLQMLSTCKTAISLVFLEISTWNSCNIQHFPWLHWAWGKCCWWVFQLLFPSLKLPTSQMSIFSVGRSEGRGEGEVVVLVLCKSSGESLGVYKLRKKLTIFFSCQFCLCASQVICMRRLISIHFCIMSN